jgi:lipoate-protein ligase A
MDGLMNGELEITTTPKITNGSEAIEDLSATDGCPDDSPDRLWPDRTWRLIPPLQLSGAWHMAIDTWLLQRHQQGSHPPSLRFYTWTPPAISLGYHQRRFPSHWQPQSGNPGPSGNPGQSWQPEQAQNTRNYPLTWQGQALDLVRRPSGGRAVLHQGDLTYAIVTSVASGLPKQRTQAYQYLCEFLRRGWDQLGFPLHYGHPDSGYIHNPNCFATPTQADLVLNDGTKLIGSAQLWRDGTVLHHGSMQLAVDPHLFHQVFGIPKPTSAYAQSLGRLSVEDLIEVLTKAAQHHFGVTLTTQAFSQVEWQEIKQNLPSRYYG